MPDQDDKHGKNGHGQDGADNGHGHGGGGHGGGGHGGGGHEEHEGAPEWLISFADNVTLMMGFFVVMLAMNMKPAGGAEGHGSETPSTSEVTSAASGGLNPLDVALGIREAFHNAVTLDNDNPADQALVRRLRERAGASSDKSMSGDHDEVQSLRQTDYHKPSGMVFFTTGSSELSREAATSLAQFADPLKGVLLRVELHGRVNASEASMGEEAARRLCYDRAMAVARELVRKGLSWTQLHLVVEGRSTRAMRESIDPSKRIDDACVEVIVTDEIVDGG
ncbi:MAG: OmpA family protein [Phycisphaeraceae bacterium]|nr:OmpA family protein [Phycisphaeraceae bacterium]